MGSEQMRPSLVGTKETDRLKFCMDGHYEIFWYRQEPKGKNKNNKMKSKSKQTILDLG